MQQLVVVAPDGDAWNVSLDEDDIIIGREPGLPVVLDSAQVSRRHAKLSWQDGDYWIEDLGSSNGVIVGDAPIKGRTRLSLGKSFSIGGFRLSITPMGKDARAIFALAGRSVPCLGQTVGLSVGSLEVGRGSSVAIPIEHNSISRRHAVISVGTDASITVEDLASSNGTWVNNQRIERANVQLGDEVRFGSVTFVVEEYRADAEQQSDWSIPQERKSVFPKVLAVLMVAVLAGGGYFYEQRAKLMKAVKTQLPTHAGATAPPAAAEPAPHKSWQLPKWFAHLKNEPGKLGKEEVAYEQSITEALTAAQNQAQGQTWPLAAASYSAILRRDPLNDAARVGLEQSEQALETQQILAESQQALALGQSGRAFSRVSTLMARGVDDPALAGVADKARQSIAQHCAAAANTACLEKVWPTCQSQAVCALAYQPREAVGWALLEEAENGLRTHSILFTPYNGATANRASFAELYPDDKIRDAVLRYGSGDADTAIKRLKAIGKKARAPLALISTVARAQADGDTAANANDLPHAVTAWSEAVAADKQLLPSGEPSVPGGALHRKIANQLLQHGERAFNRGQYNDAFAAWSQGLTLEPDNADLSDAMDRLESRAARLLDAVDPNAALDAAACKRLREVVAMTRAENPAHKDAAGRAAKCTMNEPAANPNTKGTF